MMLNITFKQKCMYPAYYAPTYLNLMHERMEGLEIQAIIAFAHFDECLNVLSCIEAHSPCVDLTQLNTPILKLGQSDFSTALAEISC